MLHPDFGGGGAYGIPYMIVPGNQTRLPIHYTDYGDESDPGPVPDPGQRAGRRRSGEPAIVTCSSCDRDHCKLYELFGAGPGRRHWDARLGRDLGTSRRTRCVRWGGRRPTPPGCRSFPASCATTRWRRGHIDHALRFTVSRRRSSGYILPATH